MVPRNIRSNREPERRRSERNIKRSEVLVKRTEATNVSVTKLFQRQAKLKEQVALALDELRRKNPNNKIVENALFLISTGLEDAVSILKQIEKTKKTASRLPLTEYDRTGLTMDLDYIKKEVVDRIIPDLKGFLKDIESKR